MSAPTGPSSKGEKGKAKYRSLDINNIYSSSRSENSEAQQTKSTAPRRHGMQTLGKVPRRPPVNLPSIRAESSGNDPSVSLIQHGAPGWGLKSGEGSGSGTPGPVESQQTTSTTSPAAPVAVAPPVAVPAATQTPIPAAAPAPAAGSSLPTGDKTWSSVMSGGSTPTVNGPDRGPSFLAHQSPQFQQEFPSLSGEHGVPPAHLAAHYGPGPALRPQSEGSWSRQPPVQPQPPQPAFYDSVVPPFLMRADAGGFPSFPDSIQTSRPRSQNNSNPENSRLTSSSAALGGRTIPETDEIIPRPIVRDEDLHRMDELARDDSWAANDDIDYNEKLAFSDSESLGEDEKEKENKLRDKNKLPVSNKDDKKEIDLEKSLREKSQFHMERGPQPHEQWRTPQNYSPHDYRSNSRSHQALRVDDSEIDIKRRQVKQNKMAALEKAKQRKEEEEKRFEESRGKKNMKEETSEFNSTSSGLSEWEKEDRLKSSENFKQMTQGPFKFPLDSGSPSGRERERELRRDRDNQQYRYTNHKPRLGNRNNKQTLFGLSGNSGFESKWIHGPQHMSGRRSHDDNDDRKERMNDNSERLRHNLRDDSNKRNYYDGHHTEFVGQSSYQAHHADIREKETMNKESDKDTAEHEGKEWENLKSELEVRTQDDRLRKDVKSQSDNFPKPLDQYEERPQRPESRDRPSRPDSRDSRASKDSRNSRDENRSLPTPLEGDYSWPDNDFEKEKLSERHLFKEKDLSRRDMPHRMREHVPGPITPQKVEAHEHKHSQSQAEKKEKDLKDIEVKVPKSEEVENSSVWLTASDDKPSVQPLMESAKTFPDLLREDEVHEDLDKSKEDGSDKKKEGIRDRREDKGGRGGSRSNRLSRAMGNYGSSANSGGYGSSMRNNTWNSSRDQRPRRGSPKGKPKHSLLSESENSADEVSASTESGKDDKKFDKKVPTSTWKTDKNQREDKLKDSKMENEKFPKGLVDKKTVTVGQNRQEGRKSDGGFAPRGEPSRRGRGGTHQRGGSHIITGSHYGPPGNKPFTTPTSAPPLSQLQLDLQDKQFSPPQPGRKAEDGCNKTDGKSGNSNSGLNSRNKGRPVVGKPGTDTEECWETTSETSDSSDMKKSHKGKNRTDKKNNRGTIGDKRGTHNMSHINGRPSREDMEGVESGNEKKMIKDESDSPNATGAPCEDNGFQEVKSKKMGRPIKEETKKSRSKPKDKMQGGVKSQQTKSYSREFVSNKPPRIQRLESWKKQQQQQQLQQQPTDVSDMNKLNHTVSSLFPLRSNEIGCPPPPTHNAWTKPITPSLRTTPPLATSTIVQMNTATTTISQEKGTLDLGEISQSATSSQTSSPTQEKVISKITREVEKGLLDGGPPVNTIIFENTNYKRDSSDINLKSRGYPMKGSRPLEKGRDRKMEDDLNDANHSLNLVGFKPSEMPPSDGKPQEGLQVPMSFSKNEDSADMKLDFAFDSDLSQLSDDKTNQSVHVGQTSAADLNQKIASVKKVWDSVPGMGGHDEPHSGSSTFTPTFPNDKSLESSGPPHHSDHSDFNPPDSVYSTGGQLGSSSSGYVVSSGAMMKGDPVSGVNTMCKGPMFQVNAQHQAVPVLTSNISSHPGSLPTPPLMGYQAPQYSGNLPAVPSPPNVMFNSQPPNHQSDMYPSFPMHNSTNRSYADFSQSYSMSQNSTFQPNVYIPPQSAPPTHQSVFQNPSNQYRIAHHNSNISQQIGSNQSPVLISSSSNSIVTGNPMKSSQPAIGTKSAASAPAPNYPSQIVLIEPGVGFVPNSPFVAQRQMQQHSSFYNNPGVLAGSQGGTGLFNSALQLGSGGALQSAASQFSVSGFQGGGSQPSGQTPSGPPAAPPPNQLAQQQYSSQVMGASFRNQGYPKSAQIPGDSAKSPSQDQFTSIFTQGGANMVVGKQVRIGPKPQPSPSPQPPQPHKYSYPPNPHVSQNNLMYQQGGVQQGVSGGMGGMRSANGNMGGGQRGNYVTPIQRPPHTTNYHQQQMHMSAQQQQQRTRQMRPTHSQGPLPTKQFYHQQGGMKVDNEVVTKSDGNDDPGKSTSEKSIKDEANSADQ